jgi:hypothetical protein
MNRVYYYEKGIALSKVKLDKFFFNPRVSPNLSHHPILLLDSLLSVLELLVLIFKLVLSMDLIFSYCSSNVLSFSLNWACSFLFAK